jgi:hypothetical protein
MTVAPSPDAREALLGRRASGEFDHRLRRRRLPQWPGRRRSLSGLLRVSFRDGIAVRRTQAREPNRLSRQDLRGARSREKLYFAICPGFFTTHEVMLKLA